MVLKEAVDMVELEGQRRSEEWPPWLRSLLEREL
jgi:hypothetical protein